MSLPNEDNNSNVSKSSMYIRETACRCQGMWKQDHNCHADIRSWVKIRGGLCKNESVSELRNGTITTKCKLQQARQG